MKKRISHHTLTSALVFIIFRLHPPVHMKSILVSESSYIVETVHHLTTQRSESSIKQGLWNVKFKANPNKALNESDQDGKVVVSRPIVGVP